MIWYQWVCHSVCLLACCNLNYLMNRLKLFWDMFFLFSRLTQKPFLFFEQRYNTFFYLDLNHSQGFKICHTNFTQSLFLISRPKDYAHEELEDYRRAEQTGLSQRDCASQFKKCPMSLFDVVPVSPSKWY